MDKAFAEALARNDLKGYRKRLNEALVNLCRIELERFLPMLRSAKEAQGNGALLSKIMRDFGIEVDSALAPFSLTNELWKTGGYWFLPLPDVTTDDPFFMHFLRMELYYPLDSDDWSEFAQIILTHAERPLYLHVHALQRLRERVCGSDRRELERLVTSAALLYNPMAAVCEHLHLKQIGVAISEDAMLMGTCEGSPSSSSIWIRTVVVRDRFSDRQRALHAATFDWLKEIGADFGLESGPWFDWSFELDEGWSELARRLAEPEFQWLKESRERVTQFDQEFAREATRIVNNRGKLADVIPFPENPR